MYVSLHDPVLTGRVSKVLHSGSGEFVAVTLNDERDNQLQFVFYADADVLRAFAELLERLAVEVGDRVDELTTRELTS